jgi:nitrite reductase/ring-hydroxylating ferredoxin subunit
MLWALRNSSKLGSWQTRRMPDPNSRHGTLTRSRARKRAAPGRYRVARVGEVAPGESTKFMLPIQNADEECFLINFAGKHYAYVNRCRHVPMAMDWIDNQFFAEEGRYLMCQTHNAYYEPTSGECIAGPPTACGKFLYRLPLEIEGGVIYARAPEQDFED